LADSAAVNASPLIFLARADLLTFLQLAATQILVPRPVADEIEREGHRDPAAMALAATPWLRIVEPPPVPNVIQA
jgi:hypothetical protein